MIYGTVCSGIEAPSLAWSPLGWQPAFFSEIDSFASAVLKHHHPHVPNLGDMTKFEEWPDAAIDVLCGGTPCQTFSVAGLRAGLDDPRGHLMLVYAAIARRYRPKWLVWENVPGVLSDDSGRSFASLLGLLSGQQIEVPKDGWGTAGVIPSAGRAYGLAWRVLDAQHVRVDGFGRAVPQRRRRVFVVGYLGDYRRAAAVFLEREGLSGNPPPRRKAGQGFAADAEASARAGGVPDVAKAVLTPSGGIDREDRHTLIVGDVAPTLSESSGHARPGDNIQSVGYLIPAVANPLTARMHKGVNTTMDEGQTMVPVAFDTTQITNPNNRSNPQPDGPCHPLAAGQHPPAIAFSAKDHGADAELEVSPTLRAGEFDGSHANGGVMPAIAFNWQNGGGYGKANDGLGILIEHTPPASSSQVPAVAFQPRFARNDRGAPSEVAYPLTAEAGRTGKGDSAQCVASALAVRRLTPRECERLQGMPDDYTLVPYRGRLSEIAKGNIHDRLAADGPRYRALGNSMAVNVMRWIGRRIEMVEKLSNNS